MIFYYTAVAIAVALFAYMCYRKTRPSPPALPELRMARSVEFPANARGGRDLVIDGEIFPFHVTSEVEIELTEARDPNLFIVHLGLFVEAEGVR